jgi:hypothetical protein
MTDRAAYIREHYALTSHVVSGQRVLWIATRHHTDRRTGFRKLLATIDGTDRDDVTRRARCEWGHFNFEDEAAAFAEIFSPTETRS